MTGPDAVPHWAASDEAGGGADRPAAATGRTADEVARANVRAWELLVEAVPGAWVRRDGGAVAIVTGAELGGFNGVWGEAKAPNPAAVARLLDAVRAQGVPHCMQLRPGWAPEVGAIARERGLVLVPGEPLMVLDDDRRLAGALEVDGLALRQVAPDEADLHAHVAAEGEVTRQEAAYRRVISPDVLATPGVRCYVGEARGKAVTTALCVTVGDVAGIFSVATLPGARRRGYGAAVTARAVRDAFRDGARWAWLSASDDGYPVYRRLGFVTLERLDFWEPFRG